MDASSAVAGQPGTIVIIDESPGDLQTLTETLQNQGHVVHGFSTGGAAMAAIKKNPPDLILLDIAIPDMNGYEFCTLCKADPGLQDVPLIFISGYNKPIDKLRAFEVGGVDYIAKPFHFEEVKARVAVHLGHRQWQQALQTLRQRMEREKSRLLQSAAELGSLKEFHDSQMHSLVHDLHQPMTGVMIYLDLVELQDGARLSQAARDTIAAIRASGHRLIKMINSLVEIGEGETGCLQPVYASCDPVMLVKESMVHVDSLKGKRTLRLTSSTARRTVPMDAGLMVRAMDNLLGSAIQFSPADDQIEIRIDDMAGDRLRIMVSDHGLEIPVEQQANGLAKRGHGHTCNRLLETEDSLSFCKLAAEAHGGAFGVNSEPGNGCSFWITLPLSQS
jgi:two-component system sensor histidine kinase/response regulator